MIKPQIISLTEKKEQQILEEMNMTPEQRLILAFQLIELAIEITPGKKLKSLEDSSIEWIELKMKHGQT